MKGLSQKTTEEDLYQFLVIFYSLFLLSSFCCNPFMLKNSYSSFDFKAEWGPLRHVRVIKERNSGISRGFAFIDFPSVVCAVLEMSILL